MMVALFEVPHGSMGFCPRWCCCQAKSPPIPPPLCVFHQRLLNPCEVEKYYLSPGILQNRSLILRPLQVLPQCRRCAVLSPATPSLTRSRKFPLFDISPKAARPDAGKWFGFDLGYDKPTNASGQAYSAQQHNGNIAGQSWRSAGDNFFFQQRIPDEGMGRCVILLFSQQRLPDEGRGRCVILLFSQHRLPYPKRRGRCAAKLRFFSSNVSLTKEGDVA